VTLRPHIVNDPAAFVRTSRPLRDVAEMMGCDPSHIRKLIDRGELEAFRYGRRGIAVFLDSVADFQERNRIVPKNERQKPLRPSYSRPASTAAFRAAMVSAEKKGLLTRKE
jgi:hypothetical protein